MKNSIDKKDLFFRLFRIALCMILLWTYFYWGNNGALSDASQFEIDDLVLAVAEEKGDFDVSFSLDGELAGEIVLSPDYEGIDISWKYSIDRGLNWTIGQDYRHKLSDVELNSLNENNDIVVKVTDLVNQEEREFLIDLTRASLPGNLYANDYENKIFGSTSKMEWSFDRVTWTMFNNGMPDLRGNKAIYLRVASTGTTLKSEERGFQFTENAIDLSRAYVAMNKIKVANFSSEETILGEVASNVADGNGTSVWSTSATDTERYIVLRLDNPIYFKGLEILPVNLNSNIHKSKLSISMDGENWTLVSEDEFTNELKNRVINLEESSLAQYIKIEFPSVYSDANKLSIALINIFEDNTKRVAPSANIMYDIVNMTNGNVTARLVDLSPNAKVISEGGLEHVFSENGTFKFVYKNELGMIGETVATVDWIDRVVPSASIKYASTSNGGIRATIVDESEPIEIVNNNGNRSYTFYKNGSFEFIFKDLAGNESRVTAVVSSFKTKPTSNNGSSKPSVSTPNKKPADSSKPNSSDKDENKDTPNDKDKDDNKTDKDDSSLQNKTEVKVSNSYSINNVTLEILGEEMKTPLALKMDIKDINKTLKAKVGKSSVLFELYFVNDKDERTTVNQNYKLILKLDSDKVFKGIFEVNDNSKLTKLEYTTRGANEIELNLGELKTYIISYSDKEPEKKKASTFDYIVALLVAIVLAGAAIIVYKKTR